MEEFFKSARILVVEDNRMNRDIIERQLRRIGCNDIAVVSDGQEGLAWLAQHPRDVIITDCQMPIMDGYEMTRRIRASHRVDAFRPYIVALSASALEEDRQRCLAVGMDAHLAKPTQIAGIRAALEQAATALAGAARPA